jgi:hypothetical protein
VHTQSKSLVSRQMSSMERSLCVKLLHRSTRKLSLIGDAGYERRGVRSDTPEVFYYPDGTQYTPRSGSVPAARTVMTCGGTDGATLAFIPR